MKGQWGLIIGLFVALLIAVFAVINMDAVRVNYVFGTAEWPLVIVIISSVLMGSILVGGVGLFGVYKLRSQLRRLKRENEELRKDNSQLKETKEENKQEIPVEPLKNSSENPNS